MSKRNLPATPALNLPQRHREQVLLLLRTHVPSAEVWAYGSRVSGDCHDASDLDLVLRNPDNLQQESAGGSALKAACSDSNLPIRVDVMDWARIPDSFRREIERVHVVLQKR